MFLGFIHLFLVNSIVHQPDNDTFPTDFDRGKIPMVVTSTNLGWILGQFSDPRAQIGNASTRILVPQRYFCVIE
jgi:hypothetical protein